MYDHRLIVDTTQLYSKRLTFHVGEQDIAICQRHSMAYIVLMVN